MLAGILQKKQEKKIHNISSLFDQKPKQIKEEDQIQEEEPKIENKKQKGEDVKIEDITKIEDKISPEEQEKKDRTIFIGNINLKTKRKEILKFFQKIGDVDKMWIRSVQVEDSKLPQKAKVILKKFKEEGTYNAYISFKQLDSVQKALDLNQTVFNENHLRIDRAFEKSTDFDYTLFVGNLPFTIKDEELHTFFQSCGNIKYVRVIRDPTTFYGKGIGYVSFQDKESFQKGLLMKNNQLQGRQLRIKKAVPLKRLQKKQLKTQKVKKELTPAEKRLRLKQQKSGDHKKSNFKKGDKPNFKKGGKTDKVKKGIQKAKVTKDSNIFAQ